jgi:hypothetical protein
MSMLSSPAMITILAMEPSADAGFVADVTTACPAGTYSSAGGRTSAWPCTPCPAGRYSTVVGAIDATTCRSCPAWAPYSLAGSAYSGACTDCASGCGAGLHGAVICPSSANSQRVSWADRPANGACVILMTPARTWAAANATCASLATGAHLLTPSSGVRHVCSG